MARFYRDLLVVSCPRSATRFLQMLVKHCGIKAGHEAMKRGGTVGMFFAVEDVWYPGKHWNDDLGYEDESLQKRSDYRFGQVWHLLRDPRKVIPSMASHFMSDLVWVWQERHTGISAGLFPKVLRSMLFWVAWNELIEKNEKIDYRIRIEDVDREWPEIQRRLGASKEGGIPEAIPRDIGTFEKGPNRVQPMMFEEMDAVDPAAALRVREMAARYGYE